MSTEPNDTTLVSLPAAAPDSEVRLPDGRLMPIRDAPVGGQAVLEGVMMRGVSHWAVAVREPAERAGATSGNGASPNGAEPEHDENGEPLGPIQVHREHFVSKIKKHRFYRLPIVRGVIALVESLSIGMKALGISANAQLDEPDEEISKLMSADEYTEYVKSEEKTT